MKKTFTILGLFLLLTGSAVQGQVLIAKWTFPTGNATDSLADGGLPANLSMAIHTEGGTSAIDFSKNGATTKAAQATGWDNGAMTKCWVIKVNTAGYEVLKLSSKQQTGGNYPGPLDYMVQYRTGSSGTWTDVPNSTMVTANNWTSAALDSIALPESCNSRQELYLRWIMTTNTNSAGGTVASTGINKIDDIYITGKAISIGVDESLPLSSSTVFPNPSVGFVTITSPAIIRGIDIFGMNGQKVYTATASGKTMTLLPRLPKGNYLIRINAASGQSVVKQMIVK